MSLFTILFWLCAFLLFVFGGFVYGPTWNTQRGPVGIGFLLVVMIVLLGIRVFPVPLH